MQKKLNFILRIATFSKFRADILEALGLSLAGGFDWVSFSILARFGIARAKIWVFPRFYINSNFPRYEFWYLYKTSTCKVMNHITRFYSSTRTNTFFDIELLTTKVFRELYVTRVLLSSVMIENLTAEVKLWLNWLTIEGFFLIYYSSPYH